MILDHNLLLFL